jgi:hypothetical protein
MCEEGLACAHLQHVACIPPPPPLVAQRDCYSATLLPPCQMPTQQAVAERLVLSQALAAVAVTPAAGDTAAALADEVAAFCAAAAREEGARPVQVVCHTHNSGCMHCCAALVGIATPVVVRQARLCSHGMACAVSPTGCGIMHCATTTT